MSKRVAVVLAGSGVYDGSEIHEAVITLLALDQAGASVECFAPDIEQMHVVNHLTGEVAEGESRRVLVESARIARGQIKEIKQASVDEFDAVIIPGGFGAAKNLCDFATRGAEMEVNEDVLAFARAMHDAGKPLGLMCIAPSMAAAICGDGVKCTIGTDADTAGALESMGSVHQTAAVDEIVVDSEHRLVTTPAYMLAERISEAAAGINRLVAKVLEMA